MFGTCNSSSSIRSSSNSSITAAAEVVGVVVKIKLYVFVWPIVSS